ALEPATIGMRVGTHASLAHWRKRLQLGLQPSGPIEQHLRLVTVHPLFQKLEMRWVVPHVVDWDLMRPPEALDLLSVDLLRPGPPLGTTENDARPARPFANGTAAAGIGLDVANAVDHSVELPRHQRMHHIWIIALDEERLVSIADDEAAQLRFGQTS